MNACPYEWTTTGEGGKESEDRWTGGGYKMHMGDPLLPQLTGGGHYKFGVFKIFDYDRKGRQGLALPREKKL